MSLLIPMTQFNCDYVNVFFKQGTFARTFTEYDCTLIINDYEYIIKSQTHAHIIPKESVEKIYVERNVDE